LSLPQVATTAGFGVIVGYARVYVTSCTTGAAALAHGLLDTFQETLGTLLG